MVITSLLRSEGPRFEPGWNHFLLLFLILYFYLDYYFCSFLLVGSYQVGYTRSHPNTEVKMLRACSVPLCSHRWERQVIYLLFFLIFPITIITDTTMLILMMPYPYACTRYTYFRCVSLLFYFWPHASYNFYQKDEPGRGRTCNLQIRSLTRFHCATGPSYLTSYSLFLSFA